MHLAESVLWIRENHSLDLSRENGDGQDGEDCPVGLTEGKKRRRLFRSGHNNNNPIDTDSNRFTSMAACEPIDRS